MNKVMNISEKIRQRYNEYVERNGCTPKYAVIWEKYKDDGLEFIDTIKIGEYENELDDERILYYVSDIDELCALNDEDNADFYVTDILCFSNSIEL